MVLRWSDDGTSCWHEPPYTWAEARELEQRMNGVVAVLRSPPSGAQPQQKPEADPSKPRGATAVTIEGGRGQRRWRGWA
jgi:hypothetical protein